MKYWHIPFAMSRVMLNVVVVVVVMILEWSAGSGERVDCENFRVDKLWAASSLTHQTKVSHRKGVGCAATYTVNELG